MTVREHISVFISIILGLAVADLLIGSTASLQVNARVQWYWLVPALAFYMVMVIVNFWWAQYGFFARFQSVSMGQFMPTLVSATTLFLLAAAVLPDDVPPDGLSLKSWYLENAAHIWVLAFIALSIVMVVQLPHEIAEIAAAGYSGPVRIGVKYLAQEWDNVLSLIAFVVLMFTERLRIHEAVVVLSLLDMAWTASWLSISMESGFGRCREVPTVVPEIPVIHRLRTEFFASPTRREAHCHQVIGTAVPASPGTGNGERGGR